MFFMLLKTKLKEKLNKIKVLVVNKKLYSKVFTKKLGNFIFIKLSK